MCVAFKLAPVSDGNFSGGEEEEGEGGLPSQCRVLLVCPEQKAHRDRK